MSAAKILFVDHDDSFSGNLVAYFRARGFEVLVLQSHKLQTFDLKRLADFSGVVFSPGPKQPGDYPLSVALYRQLPKSLPTLGVCLGHQLMLFADHARVQQTTQVPVHGRRVSLTLEANRLLPDGPFQGTAVFYNSLGIEAHDPIFKTHSWRCVKDVDNWCAVAVHETLPRLGVQFHPESFASTIGCPLLDSFVKRHFK